MMIKRWTLGLCLLGALPVWALAQSRTPQTAEDTRIEALVRALGNSSFLQRESARRELEALGPAALEPLRRAGKTGDAESARRIQELIRLFEEQLITREILTPKEVRLTLKDASVQEGIAELVRQSGYQIQFSGDYIKIHDTKLTLDTGKTSFWQALDQFCAQAHLIEKISLSSFAAPGKAGMRRTFPPQSLPQAPIVLTVRGEEKSHSSYAGAVKTEVRVIRQIESDDLTLTFITSIEPRLLNSGIVGRPVLNRILDQKSRALDVLEGAKPVPNVTNPRDIDAWIDGMDEPSPLRRFTEVRVQEAAAATVLKELIGKLTVQVDLQNEVLARVPNILDAAGKSVDGVSGGTLTVNFVRKLGNDVEVQVALQNLTPDPFGGNVIINGAGGGIVIRGNNVAIRGMVIGPNGARINGAGSQQDLPDLVDAKGQKFKKTSVAAADGLTIVNGIVSRSATIVFQATPEQAEPRELVLFGARTYTIGVPFRFENVPVP